MISVNSIGDFKDTVTYLRRVKQLSFDAILNSCGSRGVAALNAHTPVDSGLVSSSWYYKVNKTTYGFEIVWGNSDVENGFPVAIMLQYGYATGTGGYVQGKDYINPAMRPVFEDIQNRIWKAVTS